MNKSLYYFSLLLILSLLAGCGQTSEPTTSELIVGASETPSPLDTLTPTLLPSPTATLTSTATATETASPTPINQEALVEKWYTPIASTLYPYLVCEASGELITGEEAGIDKFGAALGLGILIEGGTQALNEWDADDDEIQIRQQSIDLLEQLRQEVADWFQDEITGEAFKENLDNICKDAETFSKDVVERARNEGLSEEGLEQIVNEIQEAVAEFSEEAP